MTSDELPDKLIEEPKGISSYPKIYNIGHRYIEKLFDGQCLIEEKIDGSQISFGKYIQADGDLRVRIRSKGAELQVFAPEKMFKQAVDIILLLDLIPGYTYRGEYLAKPKHNTLAYDRIPNYHIIIYDIEKPGQYFMNYEDKRAEAARLGLETVPLLWYGPVVENQIRSLLNATSILGGTQIEGLVIKNYNQFGLDGKIMMGKFVSERFKEIHGSDWKERNPVQNDIIQQLINRYKTPARWEKALQHLREAGEIINDPRDIGKLIPEVSKDVETECSDEIKEFLFKWAWSKARRGITAGLAEWYKDKLLVEAFDREGENNANAS